MSVRNLIAIVSIFFSFQLFAQDKTEFTHTIQSTAFDAEREILVFLPARYFRDTTEKFTVTYVLDAQYDQFWNMAKSNIDYMVDSRATFPMIVVGIVSKNRGSDFRPPALPLKAHFEKEVMPLIQENYRVNEFRTIVGHSWAGAFIASTLFSEQKDLFNAYVSISPSMGFNDGMLLHAADSMMKSGTEFGKFYYCSSGDVGRREAEFGGQVAVMDSLINTHNNSTLAWSKSTFAGTDHWSCVIPSLNIGLVEMAKNYWVEQHNLERFSQNDEPIRAQAVAFDKKQQAVFGYNYQSNARYIRFVADDFKDLEKYDAAMELYEWVLDLEPKDLNTHMNIGKIYQEQNNNKKAIQYFKKSLEILEAKKDDVSENFYTDVKEWLEEKMDKIEE